jgi:flagellar motility protein MotE (MotC chaperone)
MENWFKFRILPITVAMCCLTIVVKFTAVMQGESHVEVLLASSAIAEDEKPEAAEEEKPAQDKAEKEASSDKEEDKKEDKKSEKTDEKKSDKKDKKDENENVSEKAPDEGMLSEKCKFNQIEVDILQNLSGRRQEIEKWADDVKMQETVLKATEVQLGQKMTDLQSLKNEVQEMLKKYEGKEAAELKSLVKIYENMKPVDAARIFNEMDMEILLEVVDMMSERKAAPVLANMIPVKAKDLTVELAEKRKLRNKVMEGLAGAPESPTP